MFFSNLLDGHEAVPLRSLPFNGYLRVAFQRLRIASDAGLILVREQTYTHVSTDDPFMHQHRADQAVFFSCGRLQLVVGLDASVGPTVCTV